MDDDGEEKGPGLIDLDMGAWGSGSLSDPLRHAVGMRTAQDQCKMRMWNSFPQLFQNTIFHGEQDADIGALRRSGTLAERLARSRALKDEGNAALRASTAAPAPAVDSRREELAQQVQELEACIVARERELRDLRQQLAASRAELAAVAAPPPERGAGAGREALEKAIATYEKAAGLLRYVECVRPDWRNDDGSYKGIEDEHLRVDTSALEGDAQEAAEARELVASCYLNIALAAQRLGDLDQMRCACDEVLRHIDPSSVKALYRRAQARAALPGALDADRNEAIRDLATAAQLAPQDREVRALLAKLKAERKAKALSDRSAFAGLFERGEVVKGDPRSEGEKPGKLDLNDPKVQAMLDIHPGPGGFA